MHYILARREYDVEDLVALLLPLSKWLMVTWQIKV
jgi:hypothetical protein